MASTIQSCHYHGLCLFHYRCKGQYSSKVKRKKIQHCLLSPLSALLQHLVHGICITGTQSHVGL